LETLEAESKQRRISLDSLIEDLKSLVTEQFVQVLREDAEDEAQSEVKEASLQEALDTEEIINVAILEMKENLFKNRELAVAAITQKCALQAEVEKLERIVSDLEKKASAALKGGNEKLARMFFEEIVRSEQPLNQMRQSLLTAIDMAERAKAAIAREEERLRRRVTEMLAAKTVSRQTETLVKLYEAGELLRVDMAEGDSQDDIERSFADWLEAQRNPPATSGDSELSMKLEIQLLRARMEKLEREWLHSDSVLRQQTDEAAT
jgi:phage shock protein A